MNQLKAKINNYQLVIGFTISFIILVLMLSKVDINPKSSKSLASRNDVSAESRIPKFSQENKHQIPMIPPDFLRKGESGFEYSLSVDNEFKSTKTINKVSTFYLPSENILFNFAWSKEDCSPHQLNMPEIVRGHFNMGYVWLFALKASSKILDIGAHTGDTALVFAQKAKEVVAVEASKKMYEICLINSLLNPHLNIKFHNFAANNYDGTITLRFVNSDGCNGGLNEIVADTFTEEVESIDINNFILSNGNDFDLIKIDIESQDIKIMLHILNVIHKETDFLIELFHPFCKDKQKVVKMWKFIQESKCELRWDIMDKHSKRIRMAENYENYFEFCESNGDMFLSCQPYRNRIQVGI